MKSGSLKVGSQSVSQTCRSGRAVRTRSEERRRERERERESEWRTLGRHPRAVYHVARISF